MDMLLMADLGRDKMATIIQSGRDHGLPTYTQVHCQLLPSGTIYCMHKKTIQYPLFRTHYPLITTQ